MARSRHGGGLFIKVRKYYPQRHGNAAKRNKPKPKMYITIIIPTYKRPDDLKKCLQLLALQWSPEDGIEVLVCDDSNDLQTKTLIEKEFPEVQWLEGPHRGPAANRNTGAKTAQGEWLIFIDDDCLPRSEFISSYKTKMQEFQASEQIALEGRTFRLNESPSMLWEAPFNIHGGSLISCNFAITRRAFLDFGGFDERFPHDFEDMEFAARSKILGLIVHFVPEAVVDHPLRPIPTPKKLANRWESRVISSYDFGAKPWQILLLLPRHVLLVIVSRFKSQKFSLDNCKAAAVYTLEFLIFLQNLPLWVRRRRRTPRSSFWSAPSRVGDIPRRFGL
jgi:GT2 family glycosyltransferase